MQLVSARIWTRIAVSISYNSNHYTMGIIIIIIRFAIIDFNFMYYTFILTFAFKWTHRLINAVTTQELNVLFIFEFLILLSLIKLAT